MARYKYSGWHNLGDGWWAYHETETDIRVESGDPYQAARILSDVDEKFRMQMRPPSAHSDVWWGLSCIDAGEYIATTTNRATSDN